jgi:hypothetical protein
VLERRPILTLICRLGERRLGGIQARHLAGESSTLRERTTGAFMLRALSLVMVLAFQTRHRLRIFQKRPPSLRRAIGLSNRPSATVSGNNRKA